MRELAALAFVQLGFSLWFLAAPVRRPKVLQAVNAPRALFVFAGFSCLALAVAAAWPVGASYAWLFVLTAGCALATSFVLVAPVLPRVTWAVSALSGPVAVLAWLGAAHG